MDKQLEDPHMDMKSNKGNRGQVIMLVLALMEGIPLGEVMTLQL
jgi:hypothetical protein|uniref:Uncharacterized protein n=2 Tax=Picea TaxID=3328 RepID=A0A101LU33_PICGL|nr:hypothetical protein ABT39_MTgene2653 [Picea glauca]QHR90068.1 hypothetical protein Q903MT_gene4091 [Picea sitchensis]